MRKWLLAAVAVFVGSVLAGFVWPEAEPRPDVLFLRTGGAITLVQTSSEGATVSLPRAIPSSDWSAVVRVVPRGDETQVLALDSSSGDQLWTRDVPGKLEAKVASAQGRLVALGSRRGPARDAVGRSSTTLVIVGEDAPEARTIELVGNYEPEAFSTDGRSLFVVQYLPPRDPTSYRVRRLDLQTERVVGVYTVDAELQERMQGTARIQAASPDGRRLYTLYTLEGADGVRRAFIHVLSLDELWAHCVDLPPAFATARTNAIAISVAPDGKRVYVGEASTGTVAEVDTETLAVTRTTRAAFGSAGGAAHAAVGPDGRLYLGKGMGLLALDASTLAPEDSWDLPGRITGIQTAIDGRRLYVGMSDRIVIFDTATGRRLGALDPANLGTLGQLGRSTRLLDEERTTLECAC